MRTLMRAMVIAAAFALWAQSAGAVADHYQCYKVRPDNPLPGIPGVSTVDQFGPQIVEVKKLFMICNPTDKNGEGVIDPAAHLCCYKIKSDNLPWPHIQITDQFFLNQPVRPVKKQMLCNPCVKTIIP